MGAFTDREIEYLEQNKLGRLATVGTDGQPHVVPVGYYFDRASDTIQIGGTHASKTKKFRDAARNTQVTFLIDDMVSFDPPAPRGLEIRGRAEALRSGGEALGEKIWGVPFEAAWIRITPSRIVSWGIDGDGTGPPNSREVG